MGNETVEDERWKTCKHEWGPSETIYDQTFMVAFGSLRTCNLCGARLYDDYCVPIGEWADGRSILPPAKEEVEEPKEEPELKPRKRGKKR